MANHGNSVTQYFYRHSPWLLRTFMASYYGFSKSFQKRGKCFREFSRYLSHSQWRSEEEIRQAQLLALKKIIRHAEEHVPYYSELFKRIGFTADDLRTIDDLKHLPVLTKDDVKANHEQLLSRAYSPGDTFIIPTSGTTGKSLRFAISKTCYQMDQALIWYHRALAGVKYRDRTATCSGHRLLEGDCDKPPFWINNIFENQVIFSSYHLSQTNLKYYLDKLLKFQPEVIWGYPSSLYIIASFILKENITGIRPKGVFTSSEKLFDFQRTALEKAFQTKVLNYYANAEKVAFITECEHGGLHIQPDFSIVEILDDQNEPVSEGQEGRMICTGLVNEAMPLIRYDIGDYAISTHRKCACGRHAPLVESIYGRADDTLSTPDGRIIVRLGGLYKIKSIKEAQIIQTDINSIVLKIVKNAELNNKDASKLLSVIADGVGSQMTVKLEFVDRIPRGPNGKFKYMISKLPEHQQQTNP